MIDRFEPINEQGVVFLFAAEVSKVKAIEVEEIRTNFPDALLTVKEKPVRAEFEFFSANFLHHEHDIRECDLIICWERNHNGSIPIDVWELSDPCWINKAHIYGYDESVKEAFYWRREAERWEKRYNNLLSSIKGEVSDSLADELVEIKNISPSQKRTNVIIGSLDQGMSISAISQKYGYSRNTIRKYRDENED